MRTRAQASRDAALRRLTRLNRTLAITAVLGTGVITDAVANTASGHTRTIATNTPGASAGQRPAATVTEAPARHHKARRSARHTVTSSPSIAPASSVQQTAVVAVSGGS